MFLFETEFDRKYGSQQTDHKSFTKLVNDLRDTNEAHLRHLDDSFKNQIMNQTSLIQSQIQHLGMYQQQNKVNHIFYFKALSEIRDACTDSSGKYL